jgi:hypothetical protein
MTLRRSLNLSPNSEGGGSNAPAPAPVSITPNSSPTPLRDTNTKTVKTDSGNTPMPEALKGKEFSLELDNPVIAETFGKKPIDVAKEVIAATPKEAPLTDKPKLTTEQVKEKIADTSKPKVEAKVEPVVKTDTTKPITAAKTDTKVAPRDYAGYDEETVRAFKNMDTAAYNVMKKVVDERNQLIKSRQDSYLTHPEAYTLTPEYTDLNNRAYFANAEREFWKQQLINVRAGKEWTGLQGFDPKTGKPVPTATQKPSDEIEIELQNAMTRSEGLAQQIQQQGQQYVQQFKQRYDSDVTAMNAERAKRFGWVADPKGLEDKIALGGELGERTVKQVREDLLNMLPAYRRNDVLAELASDLFAGIQIYGARIRELEGQNAVVTEKKAEVLRAEPLGDTNGGGSSSKPKGMVFDMEGMPQ